MDKKEKKAEEEAEKEAEEKEEKKSEKEAEEVKAAEEIKARDNSGRKIDFDKLKEIQRKIAREVVLKGKIKLENIKSVAGFHISYEKGAAICAAAVLDFDTLDLIEKAYAITKPAMPYVPSFLSFREGPAILEAYEKLNIKPDAILIMGHGTLHPLKAGLACYVGVNLKVPTIGVAKKLLAGYARGTKVYIGDIARGEIMTTKEHAKPLFVSAGSMISTNSALEIVEKCIKLPHKLPEPLHIASRLSKKKRDELRLAEKKVEKQEKEKEEEREEEKEETEK